MAVSNTSLCNQALAMIGAKRLNDLDTDNSVEAIQCRTHFEPTRDSLLRSHWWGFASARASLAQDTVSPDFEWSNQFHLPGDFLRLRAVYDDNLPDKITRYSYAIEGQLLLTNESSVDLRYVRKVTDPTEFDSLFIEVLVLSLAIKLVMPLTQSRLLRRELKEELNPLLAQVRTIDFQETNTIGSGDRQTWIDSRQSIDNTKLGN